MARSWAGSESVSQRFGSGSIPKCHGSATLPIRLFLHSSYLRVYTWLLFLMNCASLQYYELQCCIFCCSTKCVHQPHQYGGPSLWLDTSGWINPLNHSRWCFYFLDLPDTSLFERIHIYPSSSKNMKNSTKNIDFYCFVTFFITFYLWRMMKVYPKKVKSKKT